MIALSFASLFVLFALFRMVQMRRFGVVSLSVIDPVIFLFLLLLFFNIDFWILASDSSSMQMFEVSASESADEISYAYLIFVVYCTAAAFGVFMGCGRRVKPYSFYPRLFLGASPVPKVVFGLVVCAGLYTLSFLLRDIDSILSAEVSRQLYFKENPLMHLVFLVALPAYSLYLSGRPRFDFQAWLWFVFLAFLLLVSGSRGAIILLALIACTNYTLKKAPLSWRYLVIGIPVVVVGLVVVRYVFREAWRYDSIGQFLDASGGLLGVFFQSSEVSLAEVLTMAVAVDGKLDLYPFQGLLGLLTYPVPRALFEYKPLSASGYFTELVSPGRWESARSEILVTGFGNVYLEFGLFLGAVVIFLMAWGWIVAVRRCLAKGSVNAIFYPFLLWLCYAFMRGDFFNMGSTVWAVLLVVLAGKVVDAAVRIRFVR